MLDFEINDRVMYDGKSDGPRFPKDKEIDFYIVGFNENLYRVLLGGVDGGHRGGIEYRVLYDNKGKEMLTDSRDGSLQYFWVNTSSIIKTNNIRLNNSQIKTIIKC